MNRNDDIEGYIRVTSENMTSSRKHNLAKSLQSDVELFEAILNSEREKEYLKDKYASISYDTHESGVLSSTYRPLTIEEREQQEKLYSAYKDATVESAALLNSLSPEQVEKFEEFRTEKDFADLGIVNGFGGLVLLGVVVSLMVSLFNSSPSGFNFDFFWFVVVSSLVALPFVIWGQVKAGREFKTNWYPNA